MTRKMMLGLAATAILSAVTIKASAQGEGDGSDQPALHPTVKVPETTYKYECKSHNVRTPRGRTVHRQACAYAKAPGTPKPTIECEWRTRQVRTPWGQLPEKVCD